jgi:hypothetical protein
MAAETAGLECARLRVTVLAAASTAPTASGNGRHLEAPHSRAAAPNEVRWNWHAVGCTVGIYLQIRAISRSQESGPASCLVRREKSTAQDATHGCSKLQPSPDRSRRVSNIIFSINQVDWGDPPGLSPLPGRYCPSQRPLRQCRLLSSASATQVLGPH